MANYEENFQIDEIKLTSEQDSTPGSAKGRYRSGSLKGWYLESLERIVIVHQDPGKICHSSKTLPRHRISQNLSTTISSPQNSKTLPRPERHLRSAKTMPTEDQKPGQIYVTSQTISRTKSTRKESSSATLSKSRKMDGEIKLNSKEINNLIRSNTSKSGKQQKTHTDLKYATVKENSRKVLHPQPMDVKATSRNNQVNTLPNPRKSQKKEICDVDDPKRRKSLKVKKSNLDKPITEDETIVVGDVHLAENERTIKKLKSRSSSKPIQTDETGDAGLPNDHEISKNKAALPNDLGTIKTQSRRPRKEMIPIKDWTFKKHKSSVDKALDTFSCIFCCCI